LLSLQGRNIPQDYILFLQYKNDFEFSIGDVYIRIWGADGCIELNEAYNVAKQLPTYTVNKSFTIIKVEKR
jgi:SMI1 / KNR4